ncbi:MAG TPA: response regulator [Pyrinomonadaceae bacterium]|nr:response regulator [Pyrinomonadaceae bacterium]
MPNILYVEDDAVVSLMVKETLEAEGWHVECCANGLLGLSKIDGGEHYDLLLLDNELPGVSGLELTRRARVLSHRKETPVVMFSASEYGREARAAGANVFLNKPEGIKTLAETVRRLLEEK